MKAVIMDAVPVLKNNEAFGKLEFDADGNVSRKHLLIDHMIDVSACFIRLAECRAIRRALERSSGRKLNQQDIIRLSALAFLHDIGKANSGFQAKRWKNARDSPCCWPTHAGHGIEALKIFDPDNHLGHLLGLLPVEEMSEWGDVCYRLLVASISHHGRPLIDGPQGWSRSIWKPVEGRYDPATTLKEIGIRILALYPDAFQKGGQELPDRPAFGHLFAGLVQLAD
jgi:CRISPR-associated endonuclease/helicase Cas3